MNSAEFVNAAHVNMGRSMTEGTINLDGLGVAGVVSTPGWTPTMGTDILTTAQNNSLVLQAIFNFFPVLPVTKSGVVYFPPGRYYLGRPWPDGEPPGGGHPARDSDCWGDLVVPLGVSLKFAPGAVLVPLDYSMLSDESRRDHFSWNVPGRPWDRFKVRFEIQGTIDAGAQQIFDVVFQNLEVREALDTLQPDDLQPTGQIIIARDRVREVYPEWWGAGVPGSVYAGDLPLSVVRRTTLALQAAIDAAHTNRRLKTISTVGFFRSADFISSGGTLGGVARPPIPITLSQTYMIDRELMVGETWWRAQRRHDEIAMEVAQDSVTGFATILNANQDPIVFRGVRPPGRAGSGSVKIVADTRAFSASDQAVSLYTGLLEPKTRIGFEALNSASLLGVRGIWAPVIENIDFDGGTVAARCLTFQYSTSAIHIQQPSIDSCRFSGATRQLLHLGGEILGLVPLEPGPVVVTSIDGKPKSRLELDTEDKTANAYWSPSVDMLGFRITRCVFDTGDPGIGMAPVVGISGGADQTLLGEIHACSFRGRAAPMVLWIGGRLGMSRCTFATRGSGQLLAGEYDGLERPIDGLDVFLGATPQAFNREPNAAARSLVHAPYGVCTLKDVYSTSPMLLASSPARVRAGAPNAAVSLIGVRHKPDLAPDQIMPPAILWSEVGVAGAVLSLMGCHFVRRSPRYSDDIVAPVAFYFRIVYADPPGAGQILLNLESWGARDRSGGHVVDLGTRVVVPGAADPPLISFRQMVHDLAPGSVFGPIGAWVLASAIEGLSVLDRYKNVGF